MAEDASHEDCKLLVPGHGTSRFLVFGNTLHVVPAVMFIGNCWAMLSLVPLLYKMYNFQLSVMLCVTYGWHVFAGGLLIFSSMECVNWAAIPFILDLVYDMVISLLRFGRVLLSQLPHSLGECVVQGAYYHPMINESRFHQCQSGLLHLALHLFIRITAMYIYIRIVNILLTFTKYLTAIEDGNVELCICVIVDFFLDLVVFLVTKLVNLRRYLLYPFL